MRNALFRVITVREVVVSYRRFPCSRDLEHGTDRLSRNVGKELTTSRTVVTQKSPVLIHFAVEAWNLAYFLLVRNVTAKYVIFMTGLCINWGTAVTQWLRCCATNRKVAGSIPAGVSGFFIDIKSFRSHCGPGVDSASNRNEYQEYFLRVKTAGA